MFRKIVSTATVASAFALVALPAGAQTRLQARLDSLGLRLPHYPHFRMQGCDTFRLRVGDYRIIYQFDIQRNELYLITLGHRRDIYKP